MAVCDTSLAEVSFHEHKSPCVTQCYCILVSRILSIMGYNGMDSVFVGLPNSSSFIANLNIVTYVTSLCMRACVCAFAE